MAKAVQYDESVDYYLRQMVISKEAITSEVIDTAKSATHLALLIAVCAMAGLVLDDCQHTEQKLLVQWLVAVMHVMDADEWATLCDLVIDSVFRLTPWSGIRLLCRARKEVCGTNPASAAAYPMPHDTIRKCNQAQRERSIERLSTQFQLTLSEVSTALSMTLMGIALGDVDGILWRWARLLLVTGLRTSEIIFSDISATTGDSSLLGVTCGSLCGWITVASLLKKRGKAHDSTCRPLLFGVDTASALADIVTVREYVLGSGARSPEDVNRLFAHDLGKCVRDAFPSQSVFASKHKFAMGAHFFRAVYANCAWLLLRDTYAMFHPTVFVTAILGHAPNDITSGLHYQIIKMAEPKTVDEELVLTQPLELDPPVEEEAAGTVPPAPAPKKRKRPTTVTLKGKRSEVTLAKFKRRMGMTGNEIRSRCEDACKLLLQHDVPISASNVKKLGIGSSAYKVFGSRVVAGFKRNGASQHVEEPLPSLDAELLSLAQPALTREETAASV